jgi:hypothetical protein
LTRAAIPPTGGGWSLRPVGKYQFKGFENVVEVIELITTGSSEQNRAWLEIFAAALAQFQSRNFATAETTFKRVLELRTDDGPSNFYLKQISAIAEHPVPETWAGEISLKEK